MYTVKSNVSDVIEWMAAFLLLSVIVAAAAEPPAVVAQSAALQGHYAATLPCADCPGIEYQLALNSDGSYAESVFYMERSQSPLMTSGTFRIENDVIVLEKEKAGFMFFQTHPKGLQLLDNHREPITGDLSDHYILVRSTPTGSAMLTNDTLKQMRQKMVQGVAFYAMGHDPEWALNIGFDKGMRFSLASASAGIVTPPAREFRAQDADVTRYYADTGTDTLIVTVYGKACADPVSDEPFPFKVRVETKSDQEADYTSFDGCGRYVIDPRLNDIWTLKDFNGRKLAVHDYTYNLPTLEFHLVDSQVGGSTGCNRISGRFDVRGDTIRFGPLAATRRACPDMTFEGEFMAALGRAYLLRYAINQGRLTLMNDGAGITMVLQRVD